MTLGNDVTVLQWSASEEIFEPDFEIRSRFAFQRFLTDGTLTGPEVNVITGVFCGVSCGGGFGGVRTELTADGDFVVTYSTTSYPDDVQYDIWANRFASTGGSTQFANVVSSYASSILNQSLDSEGDGDFLVVWGDSFDNAFGKRFAEGAASPETAFPIYDRPPHFTSRVDTAYNGPGSPFAAALERSEQCLLATLPELSRYAGRRLRERRYVSLVCGPRRRIARLSLLSGDSRSALGRHLKYSRRSSCQHFDWSALPPPSAYSRPALSPPPPWHKLRSPLGRACWSIP